ncbi:hypothetical protein HPB52_016440 [Rhipicephalus sanguineus]|uniref:Uncharacterized protein n=1 Tax=Rhipicephalus sanguineus TaxID=34632 RepID=A0A9D4Q7F6_RHISA|nr:hypothetical protein HPB52_016440 [Rhipicephalus sanguineus]
MKEEFQLQLKHESEKWQLAIDTLTAWFEAHIVHSNNEREALLTKLAEERSLRGGLVEQVEVLQRALDSIGTDRTSNPEHTSAVHNTSEAPKKSYASAAGDLVRDVYSYFSSSPKRVDTLKKFQNLLELKPHKLLIQVKQGGSHYLLQSTAF